LLVNDKLTRHDIQEDLFANGAQPWWLYKSASESDRSDGAGEVKPSTRSAHGARILSLAEIRPDDYLLHWTRQRDGPWPNETDAKYLDDLIFGVAAADHSKLAALLRILATGRLIATNRLTRDSRPVVCFSEVRVCELPGLRKFRQHLGRWDFETAGIAIRKSTLSRMGARPVHYGSESEWSRVPAVDRPFFHINDPGTTRTDWSSEKEWRLIGDLDLRAIGTDDVIAFAESFPDAETLASISRWPVVVLK
jgi:hypothetical protein